MSTPTLRQDDQPASDDRSNNEVQYTDEESSAPLRVEDSQYQELITTDRIPTKTGDGETVSETQFVGERPVSAGTAHSSQFEFDETEDDVVLAKYAAEPKASVEHSIGRDEQGVNASLLARPGVIAKSDEARGFSFSRASRQQMDFTGTRKGPALHVANTIEQGGNDPPGHGDPEETRVQEAAPESVHGNTDVSGYPITDPEQMHKASMDLRHEKGQKRKKKKRRNHETAPAEPAGDGVVTWPATEFAQETMEPEVVQEPATVSEPVTATAQICGERPQTPTQFDDEEGRPNASSPHSQLYGDLQAATGVQQATENTERSAWPTDRPLQSDVARPVPEPLSPIQRRSTPNETPQDSDVAESGVNHSSHRVPDRQGSARVSKRKSKAPRKTSTTAPGATGAENNSDIMDYMQILAFKVRQKEQSCLARIENERMTMQAELQSARETKHMLEEQLGNVLQQKETLAAEVEKRQTKVASYESKINRFKTFVDGLGKDVDYLKREATASRRKAEQLALDDENRKAEHNALLEQLRTGSEQSSLLRDRALRACNDAQSELQPAIQRGDYLEQQLSEKVGLLSAERDRCAKLERQITSTAESEKNLLKMLTANHNTILEKLYEFQAMSQKVREEDVAAADKLEALSANVQGLNSSATATVEGISAIRELVDSMSQRLTKEDGETSAAQTGSEIVSAIQTHLDTAVGKLSQQLGERANLIKEANAHREEMHSLNETLKACTDRIANYESDVSKVRDQDKQLTEQNASLQAKIDALQSNSTPAQNVQAQLREARAELDSKIKALNAAKTDLEAKSKEARSLNDSNTSLQDQLSSLQRQLKESQSDAANLGPEREELHRKARDSELQMRKEMAEHIANVETQLKHDTGNALKKLTSDRERAGQEKKRLDDELATCKTQVMQLQKDRSSVTAKHAELDRMKKLSESQKQEIESLQASSSELRKALKGDHSLKQQYSTVSAQLASEKSKAQTTVDEKEALLRQVADLQHAADEANRAEELATSELEKRRREKEGALESLEKQLAEAKADSERSAAGLVRLKVSCKKAVDEANGKGHRQIKALQECLSEAQADLQKAKAEEERFRSELENTWKQEQQLFDERSDQLRRKVLDAERERDEALAANERLEEEKKVALDEQRSTLLEQLNRLKQRAFAAEEQLPAKERPSSKGSSVPSRLHVPSVREGLTPSASARSTEPPRPRKKVDRNAKPTVEVGLIPAPEEIRPESRRTNSAKSRESARGPVVEQSQMASGYFADSQKQALKSTSRLGSLGSDLNDDMLSVRDGGSRQLSQTMNQTQLADGLPSFAALAQSTTQETRSKAGASTLSAHSLNWPGVTSRAGPRAPKGSGAMRTGDSFSIYADSQDINSSQAPPEESFAGHRHLQDSLSWSQAENDKYTFRKPAPHPNSGSKMAYPDGKVSSNATRRLSDTQQSESSTDNRSKTPVVRGESRTGALKVAQNSTSSSPDFVNAKNASGRKANTYYTPGGSAGKRRLSRTHSGNTVDPRLISREQPVAQKRKAPSQIVEGYEQERKKRSNVGLTATGKTVTNTRTRSQQSINDLPRFPSMPAGPSGSRNGSNTASSQSRMRTLAGGSSRAARGGKKKSKNDEYDTRFSQELDSR
ncbi:hypothetical protein LTR37_018430 [Vermiconidia calcicola]|uniref:Uncharacterized protein n=1 Tax=Vermiconidia calcicola TaxID=1690605 RepID=A0ACC3MH18_9PEZI|nr:hypothetical protein LTR37_018430 [Vermiconidia calcicola]